MVIVVALAGAEDARVPAPPEKSYVPFWPLIPSAEPPSLKVGSRLPGDDPPMNWSPGTDWKAISPYAPASKK